MRGPSMASCNRPFPSSLVPLFQSESKCKTILMKMTLICKKMKLHAELIFIWKVSHLDSFRNRGTRELGNGLFSTCNSLNISPHSLLKKNCCDLNLGDRLCIFTFFLFQDSGLYVMSGFDFYFDLFWLAWHWKPAVYETSVLSVLMIYGYYYLISSHQSVQITRMNPESNHVRNSSCFSNRKKKLKC